MANNASGCTTAQTCCGVNLGPRLQAKITAGTPGECACLDGRVVPIIRPPGAFNWTGSTIACDNSRMTLIWSCDNGTGNVGLEIEGCDIAGGGELTRISISCGSGYKAVYLADVRTGSCCGHSGGHVTFGMYTTILG